MDFAKLEQLILLCSGISFFASWGFRIRIFNRFDNDPVIARLIRGTHPTTFLDALSIQLFRARSDLSKEAKSTAVWFISLHWTGGLLLLLALVSAGLRNSA